MGRTAGSAVTVDINCLDRVSRLVPTLPSGPLMTRTLRVKVGKLMLSNIKSISYYCHWKYYKVRRRNIELFRKYCSIIFPCWTDITAPIFKPGCPSNILKFADRNSTSTVVTWEALNVTDNSLEHPNVTQSGRNSGDIFSEGEHQIKYIAIDTSGNIAECVLRVLVSGKCNSQSNSLRYLRINHPWWATTSGLKFV